jgi:hypothetical protein
MKQQPTPDFDKPVDILAFIHQSFGICGCSELAVIIEELKLILDWAGTEMSFRPAYNSLYTTALFTSRDGIFYLIAGMVDKAKLIEHGTAIRCPWLTDTGKAFLAGLNKYTVEQIDEAKGEAYDGCTAAPITLIKETK